MDIMDGPEEDRPDRMEASSSYGDSQPSTDNENEDSEDENSELENSGLDQDEIETDDEKEKEFDDKLEEDSQPVDEVLSDEQESTSKIRKIKTQTTGSWAESNIMESDEDTDDEDTRLRQLVDLIPKNFDITYKRPTTYSTTLPLYLPKSTKKRNDHFSVFVKQPQTKEEVKSLGPQHFDDRIEKLINDRLCGIIEAIRFGAWDSEFGTKAPPKRLKKAIKLLSQNKKNFSKLTGLFIGDIPENDNCKLSWIQLTDVTPLLTAFENLMHLKIRGSMGLQLHPVVHNNLRSLTIQCVGLPSKVLANICMSDFPLLERLELWLGTEIDSECSLDDLESLLFHDSPFIIKFPKLRFLALRNTSMTDELVPLVLQSDLMCQLEWLDFSKGTLSDVGAAHLFGLSNFTQIRALDITHHYCSATMIKELTKALHFISIKAGSGNALDKFPPEQRSSAVPEIRE